MQDARTLPYPESYASIVLIVFEALAELFIREAPLQLRPSGEIPKTRKRRDALQLLANGAFSADGT